MEQKILKGFGEKPSLQRILAVEYGVNFNSPILNEARPIEQMWNSVLPGCFECFPHDLALTMLTRRKFTLAIVDFGNNILAQNTLGQNAPDYIESIADIAKTAGTSLIVVADRLSLDESDFLDPVKNNALFYVQKPVAHKSMQNTIKACLKIATDAARPVLKITNPSPEFCKYLLREAREKTERQTFAFREKTPTLIPYKDMEYMVTFDNDVMFQQKNNEWFEFSPAVKTDLSKLYTHLRQWYILSEDNRLDGKRTNCELLAK